MMMARSVSVHRHLLLSVQTPIHQHHHCTSHASLSQSNSTPPHRNHFLRTRHRIVDKPYPLASCKNPSSSPEGSPQQEAPKTSETCELDSGSSLFGSFPVLLRRFGGGFRVDELGLEILSIALPAALALAADPITSLVDTAFVGHLAVGVSVSVFNLVSKLFNVPLLNITTSFVAEEQALLKENGFPTVKSDRLEDTWCKKLLPSVSTSLALAASIGIVEAVALFFSSGFLLNLMGIPVDSPIHAPAEQFLTLRAFGAPAIVVALAAQGTFRGVMDTKTPLYAIGAGNLLNVLLDLILIFFLGFGIGGAAIATVTSEYLIAFIFLWKLSDRVLLIAPRISGWRLASYLKSGGLLIGRTLSVLVTMTLATSMAAREGPVPMAAHQICLEVWLAISLLTDALALAGQALLASSYSKGNYRLAREVIYRVLQIALVTGITLGVILLLGFGAFCSLFSTDAEVLRISSSGIWFVAGSQPINAIAFVIDGLYYGVSDFGYAAYSMLIVGLISSIFLILVAPVSGLVGVWTGLFLFMTLRVVAGLWRLGNKAGPWEVVWSNIDQEGDC